MSTAIWGGRGFVGSSLINPERRAVGHHESEKLMAEGMPGITRIVWSAGWPGTKNVGDVERDPLQSHWSNVREPLDLVLMCGWSHRRILIFSSGCLYDGLNNGLPWREGDLPNFTGPVYHRHKWELERAIAGLPHVTIFRFRLPFNGSHHRRNMITKFAGFDAVMDVWQSFTWMDDLSRAVDAWEAGVIDGGIWHVTQPGIMNNLAAVRDHLNPAVGKVMVSLQEYTKSPCARSHAILDSSKLESAIGLTPIDQAWKIACKQFSYGTLN